MWYPPAALRETASPGASPVTEIESRSRPPGSQASTVPVMVTPARLTVGQPVAGAGVGTNRVELGEGNGDAVGVGVIVGAAVRAAGAAVGGGLGVRTGLAPPARRSAVASSAGQRRSWCPQVGTMT